MKYSNLISAEVIKDSKDSRGNRITTVKMVFPRFILAEKNTHRVLSRNSASSRAIPFRKMVKSAIENPFIPIAFQKEHTGMQGTEYLDPNDLYSLGEFTNILKNVFKFTEQELEEGHILTDGISGYLDDAFSDVEDRTGTLEDWWLYCRDQAVKSAILMASLGVTKQLCNRIIEPFIYHTALVTSTEWENFFELRCPKYEDNIVVVIDNKSTSQQLHSAKSKRDFKNTLPNNSMYNYTELSDLNWLTLNKGGGEIHIMDLTEKVWDAMNESTPKQLKEGEYHLPFIELEQFANKFEGKDSLEARTKIMLKIATARCARISYQTLGDNPKIDYEADIKLHDSLLAMGHMSPFEHCARAMTKDEYKSHVKGIIKFEDTENTVALDSDGYLNIDKNGLGWSRNFKGFVQYREVVEYD